MACILTKVFDLPSRWRCFHDDSLRLRITLTWSRRRSSWRQSLSLPRSHRLRWSDLTWSSCLELIRSKITWLISRRRSWFLRWISNGQGRSGGWSSSGFAPEHLIEELWGFSVVAALVDADKTAHGGGAGFSRFGINRPGKLFVTCGR